MTLPTLPRTPARNLFLRSASALAALAIPAAGQAQQAPDIAEIVVTAQKRPQSLNDVPISIALVDGEALERSRSKELRDLDRLVPNFSIQRQGAIDTLFIRGVGGGGRNIGFTTRAGVYVDGVNAGQFASLNQDMLDVERVEVLRGPQGHLFGRNTVSGAVNLITIRPHETFAAHGEAGYGNRDLLEFRAMVNAPLADGVAVRISGAHRERDGFTLNVPTGTDLDNVNRDTLRARLRAEFAPNLTLDLAGDYGRDDSNKAVGEALTDTFGTGPTPLPAPFETPYNRDPRQDVETAGGSATFGADLGTGIEFTAISGYRWTGWRRFNDLDYVPLDFALFDYRDAFHQFSQEVRVNFDSTRLSGVAGLYFLDERARTDRTVAGGTQIGLLPFGLAPGPLANVSAKVGTRSYAGFGAIDWRLGQALTLNLGARFTHERLTLHDYSTFGPAVFGLAAVDGYDDSLGESRFDPTIGLTFALNEATNLYAKYARGFKSGGWNVDFISQAQFAEQIDFASEHVDSAEIGLKSESADRRLRFALAGFYSVYDDYQIDQFVDLGAGQTSIQLRNAARAVTWGGEIGLQAVPLDGLGIGIELGYANAEFDRFPDGGGPGVDLDGKRLPYAPRFTSSANARYGFEIAPLDAALTVSANWSYRSGSFSGPENLARQRIDSRHLVDTRVELAGARDRWSLAIWARNLLDEEYIDNRVFDFFQTVLVEHGEPRTYGVTARIGF